MALAKTFRDEQREAPTPEPQQNFNIQPVCIWRAPFTECTLLDIGGALGAFPFSISPDGSTVYGSAQIFDSSQGLNVWRAVKWDTTTLAMTMLDHTGLPTLDFNGNPGAGFIALVASDDGSIIYGGQNGSPMYGGTMGPPFVRWTGGGTTATLVPDPGSDPGGNINWFWGTDVWAPLNMCSSDGSVMVAGVLSGDGGYKWIDNVYTVLPGTNSLSEIATSNSVIVFGLGDSAPARWTGTTRQLMSGTTEVGFMYGTNSDTSVVWALDTTGGPSNACAYWTTPFSGAGVYHQANSLASWDHTFSRPHIADVSYDAGSTVAVGGCPFGTYGDTVHDWGEQAVKWIGTTVTALGYIRELDLPYRAWSSAMGCNHDGSIVCGYTGLQGSIPVWWDASNTMRRLPTFADANPYAFWIGEAYGISRDGSVIFGRTGYYTSPTQHLVELYPNDHYFWADSDMDADDVSAFSLAVWVCKDIKIELDVPPLTFELSRDHIIITILDIDSNPVFSGHWIVSDPAEEYQVLFSVNVSTNEYTLYVSDVAPAGTVIWGAG